MSLSIKEIVTALRAVGVAWGDTVYVHANIRSLGLVQDPGGRAILAVTPEALWTALQEAVGPQGTVVVPTHSYTWSTGEVYRPDSSPASTGAFCEFVRKRPGARRSLHPLLSVAAVGPRASEVVDGVGEGAFGTDTPYERLCTLGARTLMVGTPYCSIRDHYEILHSVPYRYPKYFYGEIEIDGELRPARCSHFVKYRPRGREIKQPEDFIDGLSGSERDLLREVSLAKGKIYSLPAEDMLPLLDGILSRDPYRYLREEFCDRRALELVRDAFQLRTPEGMAVDAWAWRTAAGESWIWKLDRPLPATVRALGLEGEPRGVKLTVGSETAGADIVLDEAAKAVDAPQPLDDLLGRLAANAETSLEIVRDRPVLVKDAGNSRLDVELPRPRPEPSGTRLSLETLQDLCVSALVASNTTSENAVCVADALITAEMDGISTHGIARLPAYAAQARVGKVNGRAVPEAFRAGTSALRVDAKAGFAYPAMATAIEALVPLARETGIAGAAIHHSHHFGAGGYHVEKLADRGVMAILFSNSPKAVAAWGGARPMFGTNPIAFAVPRAEGAPLVIDLSLSKVARGNVVLAARRNQPIPLDWALDADGNPTTDAQRALDGTMLPMGGAKGAAMILMVEILAGVLTGANLSFESSSFLDVDGGPPGTGHFLLAIEPEVFGGEGWQQRLEVLLTAITDEPGVRLPGDRRRRSRAEARRRGVVLDEHLLQEIRNLG